MYKLRFVQEIKVKNQAEFLELEQKFAQLEREENSLVCGKRYLSVMGNIPSNTFIWEYEFETLREALDVLYDLEQNQEHTALFAKQSQWIQRTWTELYKSI